MIIEHNSHSIFSRTPFGAAVCGEKICLRLLLGDCIWPESVNLKYEFAKNGERQAFSLRMHFHSVMSGLYVYECFLNAPEFSCLIFYTFEINFENETVLYGNNEARLGGIGQIYKSDAIPYQVTVYSADFKTPEWFKCGIMYQIFPDRFYKTESYDGLSKAKNIIKRGWGDIPFYTPEQFGGEYLANDCFGGSLKGIEEKLFYLKELGIDIIYLNPIFEASSNHKYNTANYKKIDPLFGDEESFKSLCKKADELGIKIILDGVFNHTGSDSIYFNKYGRYPELGAYQSKTSEYYDWYNFESYPDKYDCWWGIKTLPHVNEESASYIKYILTDKDAVIKKWLRLGASGWRLDVVDELPDSFVKILRSEAKKEKESSVIIGEVWEDASNKTAYGALREYLGGYELDSAMNYPLRNAVISFSKEEITAKSFNSIIMSLKENYPAPAFYAMMNFLSSHDTERILTKLSDLPDGKSLTREQQAQIFFDENKRTLAIKRLNIALSLLFTLPGVPSVFYGDEAGLDGYSDPFCRKCFPWGKEDKNIYNMYKNFIALKKSSKAFVLGDIEFVYGEGTALGYLRTTKDEAFLYIANSSSKHDWNLSLELGKYRIGKITNGVEDYACDFGRFNVNLPPLSYKIFTCEVV